VRQAKQSGKRQSYKKSNSRARGAVTPRRTSRRKLDKSSGSSWKEKDDFYKFKPLMAFLQNHLNWVYKQAHNQLKQWSYIKGDSEAGENGDYLVDFFHEEKEVIKYCKENNNCKEQCAHLANNIGGTATNTKRTKAEIPRSIVDPAFITPPPMKKMKMC
jgi:hypothetical protein